MNADTDWFADEAFWEWSFPWMFPERRFAQAPEEVDQLIELSGRTQGKVLDLCCGPGRHSVELAKRGFEVTGVDRTMFLLDRARGLAASESVEVEWLQDDMGAFSRPDSFDLAVSLFTSFGYFEAPHDNQAVLDNAYRNLSPGGTMVLDVLGKEPLAGRFMATDLQELEDGGLLIQHRQILDDWTRLKATWLVVKDDATKHFSFTIWIYSGSELKRMLQDAGFESVQLYGALDGRVYDRDAKRLVAVATKSSG